MCYFSNSLRRVLRLLLIYTDDIFISRNDMIGIASLKQLLHLYFYMKYLGYLTPGLELTHIPLGLFLSQHEYTRDLIEMTHLSDAKPVEVLIHQWNSMLYIASITGTQF